MDRSLSPSWSQFFSHLSLPPDCADSYSRSFTENSLELSMISDLQPDYMEYLGIHKLGHLIIIKKRARELLSPSSEISEASDSSDAEPASKRHTDTFLSESAPASTQEIQNFKQTKSNYQRKRKLNNIRTKDQRRAPVVPSTGDERIEDSSPVSKRVETKLKRTVPSNKPNKHKYKRNTESIKHFLTDIRSRIILSHPNHTTDSSKTQPVADSIRIPGKLLVNSSISSISEAQSPSAEISHIPSSPLVAPCEESIQSQSVQESLTEESHDTDECLTQLARRLKGKPKKQVKLASNKNAKANSISPKRKLKRVAVKPKSRRVRIGVKKDSQFGPIMVKPVLAEKVKLPLLTNKRFNRPLAELPFETRGRSTSPETDDSQTERDTRRLRIISTVMKRYNNFYTTIYPQIQPQGTAFRLPLRGNTDYARPQPGVRLSLKDTLIFARQERRTFACHECSQCFETPYQLLQHSMLTNCSEIDSPYPEY